MQIENKAAYSKPAAPPRVSSKKAVTNFPTKCELYYLINNFSQVTKWGERKAFTIYFINLVKTPGATFQPNGRPMH